MIVSEIGVFAEALLIIFVLLLWNNLWISHRIVIFNLNYCVFFIILLQLNVKISVLGKYRKSIEIVSKSTRYRYRIFRRYRYFKIDPIPDTSSTRYRFRPIPTLLTYIVSSIYSIDLHCVINLLY